MAIEFLDEPKTSSKIEFVDDATKSPKPDQTNWTLETLLSGSIGGPSSLVSPTKNMESTLPTAGQALGGFFGGYGGSVAGTAAGSALEQVIKSGLRGKEFNLGKMTSDTATTAIVEGLLRGTGKVLFRREIANQTMNSLGRKLGQMKTALSEIGQSNTSVGIPKQKLLDVLTSEMEKTNVPFGKASVVLNRWKNFLIKSPSKNVSPSALMELEDDMGNVAKFASQKMGGISLVPEVAKKSLNSSAKAVRSMVSGEVDNLAAQNGMTDFGKISKQISSLKEKFPNSELRSGKLLPGVPATFFASGGGLAAGLATQNPIVGLATGMMIEGLQSPAIRGGLYNAIYNTGLGRMATLGASELARQGASNEPESN
jgi:hypothetical protein